MKKYICIVSFVSEKGKRYEIDEVINDLELLDLRYHERLNFEELEDQTFKTMFKGSTLN